MGPAPVQTRFFPLQIWPNDMILVQVKKMMSKERIEVGKLMSQRLGSF